MRLARAKLLALTSAPAFRVVLGVLISAVSIYVALDNIDYRDIWAALRQADLLLLGLALVSVAINTLGKAIRWKILLGPTGRPIHLSRYLVVLLVGQMLNTLIPAKVGELSRAYLIGGLGPAGRLCSALSSSKSSWMLSPTYSSLCCCCSSCHSLPGSASPPRRCCSSE